MFVISEYTRTNLVLMYLFSHLIGVKSITILRSKLNLIFTIMYNYTILREVKVRSVLTEQHACIYDQ